MLDRAADSLMRQSLLKQQYARKLLIFLGILDLTRGLAGRDHASPQKISLQLGTC
jgi:hypothetical protein